MPKLWQGRVPQYRHHKARGLAVVRINGVDHYLGPWKSRASLIEYDRLIGEWLIHGRVLQTDDEPAQFTIVELAAAYIKHARDYYRKDGEPTTEYTHVVNCLKPLIRLYGREPASEFGPLKLEVVRSEYVKAGCSRPHSNKQASRIRRLFKWAAGKELVPVTVH